MGQFIPAFVERFGAEPEQDLIFLQERLHLAVGISRVEHLRRGWSDNLDLLRYASVFYLCLKLTSQTVQKGYILVSRLAVYWPWAA